MANDDDLELTDEEFENFQVTLKGGPDPVYAALDELADELELRDDIDMGFRNGAAYAAGRIRALVAEHRY